MYENLEIVRIVLPGSENRFDETPLKTITEIGMKIVEALKVLNYIPLHSHERDSNENAFDHDRQKLTLSPPSSLTSSPESSEGTANVEDNFQEDQEETRGSH